MSNCTKKAKRCEVYPMKAIATGSGVVIWTSPSCYQRLASPTVPKVLVWDGTIHWGDPLVAWTSITGKPSSFTPSAHASTHATGGNDAITPGSIGAVSSSGGTATNISINGGVVTSGTLSFTPGSGNIRASRLADDTIGGTVMVYDGSWYVGNAPSFRSAIEVNKIFPASVSNHVTIDWTLGTFFYGTLSFNTTISFPTVVVGKTITLAITGAGGYGINWPAGVVWLNGAPPNPGAGVTKLYRFTAKSLSVFYGITDA